MTHDAAAAASCENENKKQKSALMFQRIFLFTDQNLNLVHSEESGRLPCFTLSSMSGSIGCWNE